MFGNYKDRIINPMEYNMDKEDLDKNMDKNMGKKWENDIVIEQPIYEEFPELFELFLEQQ